MQLTVRTYKKEVRDHVLAAIERIAKGCAAAAGIPTNLEPIVEVEKEFTPAMYNNPDLTKRIADVFRKTLGEDNVEKLPPTMGGEDFSEFSLPDHSIPALQFDLGAVAPDKVAESKKTGAPLPSLHSSKFAPVPEPTIKTGVIAMTNAVLELMKK
jgi:hippurate hydrolase